MEEGIVNSSGLHPHRELQSGIPEQETLCDSTTNGEDPLVSKQPEVGNGNDCHPVPVAQGNSTSNKEHVRHTRTSYHWIVGEWFQLSSKLIGQGTYGNVYDGVNLYTGEMVAIKISKEPAEKKKFLENESKVLKIVNDPGFPRCLWFGSFLDKSVLVMDKLGSSLFELLVLCKGSFTLKTTLMLADQCLGRLEKLHSCGLVHCDIKPSNFTIGVGDLRCNQIFLLDFGFTRPYGKQQTEKDGNKGRAGTPNYASVNAHLGRGLSRRDDLESFGYVLAKFLKGKLPWNEVDGELEILRMKRRLNVNSLFEGFPDCFEKYMTYCRNLTFEETPDYNYLRSLFQAEMTRCKFIFDCQFDWVLQKYIDRTVSRVAAYSNWRQNQLSAQKLYPLPQ